MVRENGGEITSRHNCIKTKISSKFSCQWINVGVPDDSLLPVAKNLLYATEGHFR